MQSKALFSTGLFLGLISATLIVAFMIYSVQSQQRVSKLLDGLQANPIVTTSPDPTTDQQITEARIRIADADRRLSELKSRISAHANNAQDLIRAGQALDQVEDLITDIALNSQRVAEAHADLEAEVIRMEALYNQKVDELRESITGSESGALGLSFWVGVVGIIASFSAMVIAWRKDHRDLIRLSRETDTSTA